MKRFLMTMVFAAAFMATSAQAASGKLYFSGSAGLSINEDMDFPGINVSFDPGWNVTGAVGYDFGQFRAEGEIGYRTADIDEANGIPVPNADLSTLSFMVNGYYDHEMGSSPVTPYVGVGLGVADTDLNFAGSSVGDETNMAYQFMVGLGYKVTPNLVLTGGYRYFGIVDTEAPNSHEFNLGARFMF
jgi:opacity protein-like surface antigen